MFLFAVIGLALTLATLALLAAGGYLLALRLLGDEARRDTLALAIASLLAATAEALAIGLLLGAIGLLRIELALAAQALVVGLLARARRGARQAAAGEGTWDAARRQARRTWQRLREHPALALITAHAVGSEALRGLLRPPLSFDGLMYHLLLTATWLQDHNLKPVLGNYPVTAYGFVPANGSVWFWWWMAPSHSELYVNLAALPHWLLLGVAVGGIARQMGAARHWPLASFLVLLIPTVVRFAATEYVDIFLASVFLAACFFTLRWLEQPRFAYAALAGAGLGLACGAKFLGGAYAAAWGAAAVLLIAPANGRWRARLPQLGVALLVTFALGSFFYLRNVALGAGPLALACEGREAGTSTPPAPPTAGFSPAAGTSASPSGPPTPRAAGTAAAPSASPTAPTAGAATSSSAGPPATPAAGLATSSTAGSATARSAPASGAPRRRLLPALPRDGSVFNRWSTVGRHELLDAFLGITRPQSVELGLGPQVIVLLLVFLALPFGVAAGQRRAALLAASQIAFELLFWLVVPFAANHHIFANIRYLIPACGLAFAGGVAIAEHRGMSDLWLRGIALALACQGLLQLHAEMPHGVRIAIAVLDLAAVAFGVSSGLRQLVRRRAGACAAAAVALALLGAPLLASFRVADRPRALTYEWTAHSTSVYVFTNGWRWLDEHGGDGTVDAVANPGSYFVYPAMGPLLERRALYVNVNRANYQSAVRYLNCNPRVDPSPEAWLDNLAAARVRWLLLNRYAEFDFPIEGQWAHSRPDLFTLRYADPTNLVYEYHPPSLIFQRPLQR